MGLKLSSAVTQQLMTDRERKTGGRTQTDRNKERQTDKQKERD